ncbi:acyl-CoA dehydrogenase [Anopheles sinensis]|uniref:Acyl-CoA dehydrogenase n=1 Tax=Anopheles sinensis TaxID=74873 RepID=A0A084VGS8_ANOSI|nr:acyl-CoA dehydrogenase [Anopheles sinensis]
MVPAAAEASATFWHREENGKLSNGSASRDPYAPCSVHSINHLGPPRTQTAPKSSTSSAAFEASPKHWPKGKPPLSYYSRTVGSIMAFAVVCRILIAWLPVASWLRGVGW